MKISLLSQLQKITELFENDQLISSHFYRIFYGLRFEKIEKNVLPPTPLCRFCFTHDLHYILTPMCLHRAAPEFSKLAHAESATGISFKIHVNRVHTLKKLRNQYEPHCSSHFAINIFWKPGICQNCDCTAGADTMLDWLTIRTIYWHWCAHIGMRLGFQNLILENLLPLLLILQI